MEKVGAFLLDQFGRMNDTVLSNPGFLHTSDIGMAILPRGGCFEGANIHSCNGPRGGLIRTFPREPASGIKVLETDTPNTNEALIANDQPV